ncbi:MAG: MurR/RpiR family transcriptional regulator [Clostridia bacterium]
MEGTLFTTIRTKYNTLSPTQKNIADFVLSYPDRVILFSIGDLAQKCSTSEATIMRFLRKLDFNSYQVFRVRMAQEISAESTQGIYEEITPDDTMGEIKKKVIQLTVSSVQDLHNLVDDQSLNKVIDLMSNAKRIIFLGVGASSVIAEDAFHKFIRLALNVNFCSDSHIMSILGTHTTSSDLIFAVSHSGESREILDAVELARNNGAKIVAMTSYAHSTLMKIADVVLLSSTNETAYRSDAMISRIIQLVVIDMLYVAMVLKIGPAAIKKVNQSRLAVAGKKT